MYYIISINGEETFGANIILRHNYLSNRSFMGFHPKIDGWTQIRCCPPPNTLIIWIQLWCLCSIFLFGEAPPRVQFVHGSIRYDHAFRTLYIIILYLRININKLVNIPLKLFNVNIKQEKGYNLHLKGYGTHILKKMA